MVAFLYILVIGLIIYVVILGNKVHWLEKKLDAMTQKKTLEATKPAQVNPTPVNPTSVAPTVKSPTVKAPEPKRQYQGLKRIDKVERPRKIHVSMASVLSKMGIGLVLIGIGFLFKWGYDQGFITEFFTIVLGILIGWGLIAFGRIAFNKGRLVVSQIVYGGGIATLYITVYGAYGAYQMLNDLLAFLFLILVSLIAFFISLTHQKLSLSVTALLGSLIIPLLVDVQFIGFFGFGLYVIALALLNGMIFYYKRWRSLQLLSIVGIYLLVFIVIAQVQLSMEQKFELGILFFILYIVFNGQDILMALKKRTKQDELWISSLLIISIPLFTIFVNKNLLEWSVKGWTLLFGVIAIGYFSGSYAYYKKKGEDLINNSTLVLMAVFAYFAVIQFFEGQVEWMILLLMGHVFFYFYHRQKAHIFQWIGHGVSGIAWITILGNSIIQFEEFAYTFEYIGTTILIYLLFIGLLFWQGTWKKQVYGSLIFFGYGTLFNGYYAYHVVQHGYRLFGFLVLTFLLGAALWILSQRYKLLFAYTLPAYGFILFFIRIGISWDVIITQEVHWIYTFMVIGSVIFTIGLYMRRQQQNEGLLYQILGSMILLWSAYYDVHEITQEYMFGLLAAGLLLALMELAINHVTKKKDISTNVYRGIFFLMYGFGLIDQLFWYEFRWTHFIVEIILLAVFIWHLYHISKKPIVNYLILTAVFYLYTYGAFREVATGLVTLFWAAMGVGGLVYGILKRNQRFSYVALGLVVFVAGRLVLIDLASVEVYWKVITSMVFGSALLAISYFLQPYFDKE